MVRQVASRVNRMSIEEISENSGSDETSTQIRAALKGFDGESSLKRIFWEALSYDRVREPLPLTLLPPSVIAITSSLELFAETRALAVVILKVRSIPDDGRIELAAWAIKRNVGECVILLTDSASWTLIYPDETLKPRVRALLLPGERYERGEIAEALVALSAAHEDTGDEFSTFELADNIDAVFPGPTPNVGAVLTDFEWMEEHPNPEMRELLPFIRAAGRYPLLTATQERGEDLTGSEVPSEETSLSFQEWRLVMHNLRLVVWLANKVPPVGMTLSDLVQEGCLGLITAAKRFDPSRENRFSTYAWYWIRQAMFRALHNQCSVIRWPVYRSVVLLPALIDRREDGLRPGERQVRSLEGCMQRRLWRLSQTSRNPVDSVMQHQARTAIDEAIAGLKRKERPVIERRFGLVRGYTETLESIGQDMRLTRERVRQLEAGALLKLGQPYNEPLRVHWSALEWRQSCSLVEGSLVASAPFHDLAVAANNVITES